MMTVPRQLRSLFVLLLAWLTASATTAAWAFLPDPADDWRTARSPHFIVHFEQPHRAFAQQALEVAEKVYGPVTKSLGWEPYEPTHIVLIGNTDLANGYATPLPFNKTGIFLTPPDFSQDLVRGQWLELVIHHELVHIVHLDKGTGAPGALRNVFGRFPFLFPNLFQPRWMVEGIATWSESAPALGIGRLRGPFFEATLRDERQRGFRGLRELNADGRNPPLFSAYLYGAYFWEFIERRYGKEATRKLVDSYSDNLLPFRLHSVPYEVTGKMMDELYAEFIADLTREVDARAAPILARPAAVGEAVGPLHREVYSLAAGKGRDAGTLYAITDDGLRDPRLQRFDADGGVRTLAAARYGTRIDVRADGAVLASQLEICDGHDVYFDLYVLPAGGSLTGFSRLTKCERYFRAVWNAAGDGVFALRHEPGAQSLVKLDARGGSQQVLLPGSTDVQWIDLAAAPDGRRLALVGKRAGSVGLYEFDLTTGALRPLHVDAAFLHSPHYQGDTLYFLSTTDDQYNVWRVTATGDLQRVTHAHTAVTAFGGIDGRGQLALAVLDAGHTQLRRMREITVQQAAQARTEVPSAAAPSALPPLDAAVTMTDEADYSALATLAPRSWFPVLFADRNTFGLGVSTFGSDALGWHRYYVAPLFEFTQGEPLGLFEYVYHDRHYLTFDRAMAVTRWREEDKRDKATEYERATQAQWISLARLIRWDWRVNAGVGAALAQKDVVVIDGATRGLDDERLAAALLEYDSSRGGILSEGPSQGLRARVLYESYRPFKSGTAFDGDVTRLDLGGYLPLGKAVLALRATDAQGRDRTEDFELGGSFSEFYGEAPRLNERRLALRGYKRGLAALRGQDARLASAEVRFPLVDIDRHAMVPPIGINRLSAAVFYDMGRVSSPTYTSQTFRGVGFEVLGELRLGYLFGAQLRAGVAHGLDDPGDTQVYLQIGRSFR